MFQKIMNELQNLGLSRRKVRSGLVQLARNPHVCLDRHSIDHYVRKRKYEETCTGSPPNQDPEPSCKSKQSEMDDNTQRKEIRTSCDQFPERLTDSRQTPSSPNNQSGNVQAATMAYNADHNFVGKESQKSNHKIDGESSNDSTPEKKTSREKHVDHLRDGRENESCKECKGTCSCNGFSSSRDDDVFESDEDASKKNQTKVPELIDDRVGKDIQRDIGKIKLNLNNFPGLKERFLKELIEEKLGPESSNENQPEEKDDADSFKKRRRICTNDSVSIARKEKRTRRKREKFRQLFGSIQTQSEDESEQDILNIRKRRKKDSSDSYDSGVCQEDDASFNEPVIQNDLKMKTVRDGIVEPFNCREMQLINDTEIDKTAESFPQVRKDESTEHKCNKDKDNKDKDENIVGEDFKGKKKKIRDKINNKENDKAFCNTNIEVGNTTEGLEEDNTHAASDKSIESDNTEKDDRVICNDNVTDKSDTILSDNVEITCSSRLSKDADLRFSDKHDSVSHDSKDNNLLNKENLSEHAKEGPMSSLTVQGLVDVNKSSVAQKESNKKGFDLSISISSERFSENVEDKRNVADILDSESGKCNETNTVAEVAEAVPAALDKSVDDNVDTNSPKDVKPLIGNMQELSKELLMSAAKNYFTEHLEDIKNALVVEDALRLLPEKMAKEFVESLGVPTINCKDKVCDSEDKVNVDANRNICEKSTDDTASTITRRKNNELSSHTVSDAQDTPENVRTDTKKDDIHLESATQIDNQNAGSKEVEETSSKSAKSIETYTEIGNSQNKAEDLREKVVEPARSSSVTENIGDVIIKPVEPAVAKLRVRTGAELGARWCPTPLNSSTASTQRAATIVTNENIAPTSASVPPLSTTSPTIPVIPPPASAPPLTVPISQEAHFKEFHEQIKPILTIVIQRIWHIRRNLEKQMSINGIILHQPVHVEYLSRLQDDCVTHAVALKQAIINLLRLFGISDVQKLLSYIVKQFNLRVKNDRNLTLKELSCYLHTEKEPQTSTLSSQKTAPQYNKSTNSAQPAGNAVGGSTSYVRVNVPLDTYMNAPLTTNNASYVPNATQGTWQSNKPQKPPSSYMAATSGVAQQHVLNGGVNQVSVSAQNTVNLPNSYQTSQIPQMQRVPGVTPSGQSSQHLMHNVLGTKTAQSISTPVNVAHAAPQRGFQQSQSTPNVSQRMAGMFQNTQPAHTQQWVNPIGPPNAQYARPVNLTRENVGQVPQQGINTPQVAQTTTVWPNLQYLHNVYEQAPNYVTQGINQVNAPPHIIQQSLNPYQTTQQQPNLFLQNGQVLTALPVETMLQRPTVVQPQNLNPSCIVVGQGPILNQNVMQTVTLPVQTIPQRNGSSALNSSTNVPQPSSATSNAKVSRNIILPLQLGGSVRERSVIGSAKPSNPPEVKNVKQNSKDPERKRTVGKKVNVPNVSFTNWSLFTEIQKVIMINQLDSYWKCGLNYIHVPKEERQPLGIQRRILKLFYRALIQEIQRLQHAAEANLKNSSADNVAEQAVVSHDQVTQRSSESLRNTVQEEDKSTEKIENQMEGTQHDSMSSEKSKKQSANDEPEKLQEVPTNSRTEIAGTRKPTSILRDHPLTSLPTIVEDTYKISNINTELSAEEEKQTRASTKPSEASNVNETEVVGQSSPEEKSKSSNISEEQVEGIPQTDTSTENERQETTVMNYSENPELPNQSSVLETQEVTKDTSQLVDTNTEPTVAEDLRENSETLESPEKEIIKPEESKDGLDEFEQMETGIPEEEISADLSVFEESMDNERGLILIEENSSDKILSQEDLESGYALIAYEQEMDDIEFVIPNIADVRSIEPEVFQQMNTEVDENVIFAATDETAILAAANDNTISADEMARVGEDTIIPEGNDDIFEERILCLRCKRTQSMVLCKLCLEAHYCSKRCQELHWKAEHHKTCRQSTDMLSGTERPSTLSGSSSSPVQSV